MGRGGSRAAVVLGLTLLLGVCGGAAAQEKGGAAGAQKPTKVETARWAAGLNAASAAGKEWISRNSASVGRVLIPVLNKCLPDTGDEDEVTAFSLYVRLSRQGRVREVATDLDPSLSACLTEGARELQVPQPPRDDYWVQVNLAAPL